jgi:hypothetical protein
VPGSSWTAPCRGVLQSGCSARRSGRRPARPSFRVASSASAEPGLRAPASRRSGGSRPAPCAGRAGTPRHPSSRRRPRAACGTTRADAR